MLFAAEGLTYSIVLLTIDTPVSEIHLIVGDIPQNMLPPEILNVGAELSQPNWHSLPFRQRLQESPSEIQFFGKGLVFAELNPDSQQCASHEDQNHRQDAALRAAPLGMLWQSTAFELLRSTARSAMAITFPRLWETDQLKHSRGSGLFPVCERKECSPCPKKNAHRSTHRGECSTKHSNVDTRNVTSLYESRNNLQTNCAKCCKQSGD